MAAYTETVQAYNPIAYWPMTEAIGTTATCLTNAAMNGTYARDVSVMGTQTGIGDGNTAPTFDGANDCVDINTAALGAAFSGSAGTISAWCKVSGAGVWTDGIERRVVYLYGNATNNIQIEKRSVNNQFYSYYKAGGTAEQWVESAYSETGWIHTALTWDAAADEVRIYINGIWKVTSVGLGVWATSTFSPACIGASSTAPAQVWSGGIAHVALFDAALGAAAIADLADEACDFEILCGVTCENAASALTIPTYTGGGVCTHPDVIDFGAGNAWNGYRYWMAMTPMGGNEYENPSILASDDGTTWADPGTNPIVPAPVGGYNSDPDIIMEAGGATTMWLFYREVITGVSEKIYALSSADGVNWSTPVEILSVGTGNKLLSPAVIYHNYIYKIWTVDTNSLTTPYDLEYRISTSPDSGWSSAVMCSIDLPAGKDIWHVNVNYSQRTSTYYMLADMCNAGTSGTGAILYFSWSKDGITWQTSDEPLLGPGSGWDGGRIYRSSWVRSGSNYDLFYGGVSAESVWRIGRTTVYNMAGENLAPETAYLAHARKLGRRLDNPELGNTLVSQGLRNPALIRAATYWELEAAGLTALEIGSIRQAY